jgi:tetratricopeptide (TPR) repeat protein
VDRRYRDALHDALRRADVRHEIGQAYVRKGLLGPAIAQFETALDAAPSQVETLVELAGVRSRLGPPLLALDARSVGTRVPAATPAALDPKLLHKLGRAYLRARRETEAARVLEVVMSIAPAADVLVDLGDAYVRRGDVRRARTAFERALVMDPTLAAELEARGDRAGPRGTTRREVGAPRGTQTRR